MARTALASLVLLAAMPVLPQPAPAAIATAEAPAAGVVVDFDFVRAQVVFPAKPDVTIFDTRSTGRGYDLMHIPGAVSLPEDEFDKFTDLLPLDRKHMLVFYCQDAQRESSRRAAQKAARLGFTNIRVYVAGLADWLKNGGTTSVSAAFLEKMRAVGMPHVLIDARPANTAAKGMIPGAINIPDAEFDKHLDKLPADKDTLLIYYCGGIDCPQSANSSRKARELGYSNVKTYPEGYPEWKRLHQPAAAPVGGGS